MQSEAWSLKPEAWNSNPEAYPYSRREMLSRCGMGLGMLGLTAALSDAGELTSAGAPSAAGPLAPKHPHFPARAKQVVHLFMNGGPSHVDTFDPKPKLNELHGKSLPSENLRTE